MHDAATGGGMAFVQAQLQKLDPKVREPLASITWFRDMPVKDGSRTAADEGRIRLRRDILLASMSPKQDRWQKIKELVNSALEREPKDRSEFIAGACASDPALRRDVESMVARVTDKNGILSRPIWDGMGIDAGETITILRSPSPPNAVPRLLKDRYRVERELGRGGLGVVYLARDESLQGRRVVIKMPADSTSRDPWLAEKFGQEVKALALIDHPGVVGALDCGIESDGRPFLVIQYIDGRPLSAAITANGVQFHFAADVLQQIGQALDAAHARNIWHRDLKPANIMLQTLDRGKEHVRLIDFGIATIFEGPGSEIGTRVAGTPAYMAPEQLKGRVSAATDIFAMGVVAHELVTGRRPFNCQNQLQLYELQKAGLAVKPSQLRPGLPSTAETLILQALSFYPEDRPRNAAEFGEELARTLTTVSPGTPPASRRKALTAGLGGTAVLAAGALWISGREPKNSVSWSLMVQSDANASALAAKVGLPLRASDKFFLSVRASHGGYLYLVSDDPSNDTMNTLGSFLLRAGEQNRIPPQRPFEFDGPSLLDFWCVWSQEALPELEPLSRWLNEQDRGIVGNAGERARIRQFLVELPQLTPSHRPGETILIGGRRIAWKIEVEAR